MPIFEFTCQACGKRFEKLARFGDTPPCPDCGAPNARKLLSAFAYQSKNAAGDVTARSRGGSHCSTCTRSTCAGC